MQTDDVKTTIVLVRHGETALNVAGHFRGRADPPLTERGIEQARAVAQALVSWRPLAVFASPRLRAQQTAAAIGARVQRTPELEPRLDDIDHGSWTGLSRSEVASRWPEDHRRWLEAPEGVTLPNGESASDVVARMASLLDDVRSRAAGGTTVLVTHDVAIRLALCHVLGAPLAAMHRIHTGLTSMTVLVTEGSSMVVDRVNDGGHLETI
ncbi:MAG TPA: histidine phosphatase family protein [Polyangiaceae bacterium]|jgi:probable phosphoglycerate mutase|nr:histidine phosphatase family protein [Polyangiaceae bacterium]